MESSRRIGRLSLNRNNGRMPVPILAKGVDHRSAQPVVILPDHTRAPTEATQAAVVCPVLLSGRLSPLRDETPPRMGSTHPHAPPWSRSRMTVGSSAGSCPLNLLPLETSALDSHLLSNRHGTRQTVTLPTMTTSDRRAQGPRVIIQSLPQPSTLLRSPSNPLWSRQALSVTPSWTNRCPFPRLSLMMFQDLKITRIVLLLQNHNIPPSSHRTMSPLPPPQSLILLPPSNKAMLSRDGRPNGSRHTILRR